jgi:hypothetical protein
MLKWGYFVHHLEIDIKPVCAELRIHHTNMIYVYRYDINILIYIVAAGTDICFC